MRGFRSRDLMNQSEASLPGDDTGKSGHTLEAGQAGQGLVPGAENVLLVFRQLPDRSWRTFNECYIMIS